MTVRVTERSVRIPISDDVGEMICFYNPIVRRFYCFQFAYRDRFFRIVRYIRRICICATCTFESGGHERHWSKNLYVESMVCYEISDSEYKDFKTPAEFYAKILELQRKASENCGNCFSLFDVNYEIAGYELRIKECYSYCCASRFDYEEEKKPDGTVEIKKVIMKSKCYDETYWSAPTPIRTDIKIHFKEEEEE